MKRRSLKSVRSNKGQGIIEGAVGLMMVVGGGIAITLFILNAGSGMYFKQKLQPATTLAAQFAAAHATDSNLEAETTAFVQALLPKIGISPSNLKVATTTTDINGDPGMQVTITNNFPVFGAQDHFSNGMTLADTEVVVW